MTITFKMKDGDIMISAATGRPLTLADEVKFHQDIRENLDNDIQPDGTGAGLDSAIALVGDVFSLRAEISRRITRAFAAYKETQNRIQRTDRTEAERFSRIVQVLTFPLQDAQTGEFTQTSYVYRIDVISDARTKAATVTGTLTR